ncbi:MAG: VCBS repeat-containing protein [Planctomycetaceae bacterium]
MKRFDCLQILILSVLLLPSDASAGQPMADGLTQLHYNNPGLTVDLGVGLWAWPVPCDADGDGDFDLIVSCPDKPSNGVWLFENTQGNTATHKMTVFEPAKFLSRTVHYVMPSYVNGGMRILSPGAEYVDFVRVGLAQKMKLPIESNFHKPLGAQPKGPKVRHNQWRYVDYNGDSVLDLVVGIEDWSYYGWDDAWNERGEWTNGTLHGWVYVFVNKGSNSEPAYEQPFFVEAAGERLNVFGCPSPSFEDFDNDGDLDLICGEFLDGFTWFENTGSRTAPVYAAGARLMNDQKQPLKMDLEMIVPVAFDWDKDGDKDLIVGDEDGRVAFVENVSAKSQQGPPQFKAPQYFQQKADTLKCGALATPVGFDWDGDGDTDIVSGNTAGYIEIFENLSGAKVEQPSWAAPVRLQVDGKDFRIMAGPNGSIQGPAEAKWGYTTLSIADWDHDGLPDIIFNSILSEVQWLKNIGSRTEPKFAAAQSVDVEWETEQPRLAWGWLHPKGKALLTQWRTTPVVHDFNKDGLQDLVMLDHEGYLAFFERAQRDNAIVLKSPRRAFIGDDGQPIRLNPGTAGRSGRRKLCVTDWDGDGRFDLLLNSANADFLQQVDYKDGLWVMKNAGTLAQKNIEGHDVSPTTVDFDGNGIPDFVGGAEDGRFYYLKNPRRGVASTVP